METKGLTFREAIEELHTPAAVMLYRGLIRYIKNERDQNTQTADPMEEAG